MYSAKYENDLLHFTRLKEMFGDRIRIFITQENTENSINRRIEINDFNKIANKNNSIYVSESKKINSDKKNENDDYESHKLSDGKNKFTKFT